MLALWKFIVVASLLCCISEATETDQVVKELTKNDFEEYVQQQKYVFVEFYAPWCGVCNKFAPEFEKAASAFQQTQILGFDSPVSVAFAKLDAWNEEHINITTTFSVSGYPTCILFVDGAPTYRYDGDHSSQSVIDKITRQIRPNFVSLKSLEEIDQLKNADRIVVISFFESTQSEEWNAFLTASKNLKQQFVFASFLIQNEQIKNQILEQFQIPNLPYTLLFKSYEADVSTISNTGLSASQFSEWILSQKFPLLGDINKENSQLYIHSGVPLLFIFVENESQKEVLKPVLLPIAAETKFRLNFVFVNWTLYGSQAIKLGLSGLVVPSIAIENTTSHLNYAYNESSDITEENIRNWTSSFLDGRLEPSWKSQSVSLTNTSHAVIQIVGKNYEELVLRNSKDVFIVYYAPWCGHCKNLEPIWEELATFVLKKNSKYNRIIFAKMDATENDIPSLNDSVNSFPTIRVYKAEDKANPITFSGTDRSLVSLLEFVRNNASQPHKLKKIVKKYNKKMEKNRKKVTKTWQVEVEDLEDELEDELHDYHEEEISQQILKDEL